MNRFRSLALTCAFLVLAWASFGTAEVLTGLLGEMPIYPNATVKMMEDSGATAYLTLETAAPLESVLSYYKSRLQDEGWSLDLEIVTDQGASADFSRPPGDTFSLSVEHKPYGGSLMTTTISRNAP